MFRELYTSDHGDLINEGELTASIQARTRENRWRNFRSKEEYLSFNAKMAPEHMERIEHLIEFCKFKHIKDILSLGSGESIDEITLKKKLNDVKLVCTDHDSFICRKLSELCNDIDFKVFDMKRDNPYILGNSFDMVLFCGSDYVMNNAEYLKLLSNLNAMGIKYIYIINSPYLNVVEKTKQIARNILRIIGILVNYTTLNYSREPIISFLQYALTDRKKGIFHGYQRDIKELNMIYKKSNYDIIYTKFRLYSSFKYIKILTARSVDIILEKNNNYN